MTAVRRDGNESPFSDWVRKHPGLDSVKNRLVIADADYWFHQYRAHRDKIGERSIDSIMLVELKTFSANLPFSQRDTLRLIADGLREAFLTRDGNVRTRRVKIGSEIRVVRMYGAFLLRLSGDRPDNSNCIEWHGRTVDEPTLTQILRFDRDPITLVTRTDRRHHSAEKRMVELPFDGEAA